MNDNSMYMEQIINESGIKGTACSKIECASCDNILNCYMDASKVEDDADINYGGYETEIHY